MQILTCACKYTSSEVRIVREEVASGQLLIVVSAVNVVSALSPTYHISRIKSTSKSTVCSKLVNWLWQIDTCVVVHDDFEERSVARQCGSEQVARVNGVLTEAGEPGPEVRERSVRT